MSHPKVALITGAYRGLGLETGRQLAERGYSVILTGRDPARGSEAAETLRRQGGDVRFQYLDVTDEPSIQALAAYLRGQFPRLDVLVNNAGIYPDAEYSSGAASAFVADLDTVRRGLETNTLGALRMCQVMIPLMAGSGRVVNVSSGMGQLTEMNGCFPGYRLSKTALNAVTRIFADELGETAVKVNSVCPGWVRTDMGGPDAPRSVAEGAAGIVWAATLPDTGPTGGFFRDGLPIPW
jgi:NAD(P)-dependent dehydrogenase (short-subunit alcohol dehydrogenase family)